MIEVDLPNQIVMAQLVLFSYFSCACLTRVNNWTLWKRRTLAPISKKSVPSPVLLGVRVQGCMGIYEGGYCKISMRGGMRKLKLSVNFGRDWKRRKSQCYISDRNFMMRRS